MSTVKGGTWVGVGGAYSGHFEVWLSGFSKMGCGWDALSILNGGTLDTLERGTYVGYFRVGWHWRHFGLGYSGQF